MTAPDVIVIGAGIAGSAAASELARRGVRVLLCDRAGVSEGTTGRGEGNVLVSDKQPGPELDLALAGLAVYAEIEARLGSAAGIRRMGGILLQADAEGLAAGQAHADRLAAAGVAVERLDGAALRDAEPHLAPDLPGGHRYPADLACDPVAITRALADDAAEVRTGCDVTAIRTAAGRVAGVTLATGQTLDCRDVVLAAGPWSAALAATVGLNLPVEPRKGTLAAVGPAPGLLRHKVYDGGYLTSVASADPGLQVTTVLESTPAGEVLVGSSRQRVGFDTAVDDAVVAAQRRRAARFLPTVGDLPVLRAWAGLRPWLPDNLPAVGASGVVPGLWVTTGHEGAGVALGPVSGRLLAQMLVGEDPVVAPAAFDPDRFAR